MARDYIKILELAKRGEWDEAHQQIQRYSDPWACLIHGYLHRVEGDLGNARYWYRRAETDIPDNTLQEEFKRLYSLVSGTADYE